MGNVVTGVLGGIASGAFGGRSPRSSAASALDRENRELQREQFEREKALQDPALDSALAKYEATGEIDEALSRGLIAAGVDSVEQLGFVRDEIRRKQPFTERGIQKIESLEGFDPLEASGRFTDAFRKAGQQAISDIHSESDVAARRAAASRAFRGTGTSDIAGREAAAIEGQRAEALARLEQDNLSKGLALADAEYGRTAGLADTYRGLGREAFTDIGQVGRLEEEVGGRVSRAPFLAEREYLGTVSGNVPQAPTFDTSQARFEDAIDARRAAERSNIFRSLLANEGAYVKKNPFKQTKKRR